MNKLLFILSVVFVSFVFNSCASVKQEPVVDFATDDENTSETENVPESTQDENTPNLMISTLADSYATKSNEIPEVYSRIKEEKEVEVDLTKGFRIQIYSGENVFDADTIASQFRAWSDTTINGYQAETYTFFKTPYYRVHVGDFHDQGKALSFSRLVKRAFRDAWVVYDSVDPYSVPADTTKITLREF